MADTSAVDDPNPQDGTLVVKVIEARNLEPKDSNGKSDPYCVITMDDDQKYKTKVIKKSLNPQWHEECTFGVKDIKSATLTVMMWDKDFIGKDFQGMVEIALTQLNSGIEKNQWFPLQARAGKNDEVTGDIRLGLLYTSNASIDEGVSDDAETRCYDDFEIIRVLGKGHYGKVVQARGKFDGVMYAMKIIKKDKLNHTDVEHTMAERQITAHTNHPFMIHLHFSFQTEEKLYLVMDFVNGGEMFFHFQFTDHFTEERAKFYAAELILVFEYLHSLDIVYRDLKPENILFDADGHVRLADFGLCKLNVTDDQGTKTFCGTPEYMSPEQLRNQGYGKSVDWWALGCVIYEMVLGLPPFFVNGDVQAMYQQILYSALEIPSGPGAWPVSDELRDLITQLLKKDPEERIGCDDQGVAAIKHHPWFADIDWVALYNKEVTPPYKPDVNSDTDALVSASVAGVEPESMANTTAISASVQAAFAGFTYDGTENTEIHNAGGDGDAAA